MRGRRSARELEDQRDANEHGRDRGEDHRKAVALVADARELRTKGGADEADPLGDEVAPASQHADGESLPSERGLIRGPVSDSALRVDAYELLTARCPEGEL
jgi:hypothetical protein